MTLFEEPDGGGQSGAELSEDGVFRFRLWRTWDADRPVMTFVMLNPSTADADTDDKTTSKCIHYAKREGYGGIVLVNLFPFRTHKPKYLVRAVKEWPGMPVVHPDGGRRGLATLIAALAKVDGIVVAAWGAHPIAREQANVVVNLARMGAVPLWCLGVTKDGSPRHPLYLKNDASITRWP